MSAYSPRCTSSSPAPTAAPAEAGRGQARAAFLRIDRFAHAARRRSRGRRAHRTKPDAAAPDKHECKSKKVKGKMKTDDDDTIFLFASSPLILLGA